ncbi:MAG: thiamine pyrophosphate-binding protein, partial [Pseudomonadota bacterium]
MMSARRETAAQALVQTLVANDVDTDFCVPGESYLAVLDALVDSDIKVVVCRQEGGAANMADAYGKLTGKPGICMVTRGPGATNASIGIHTAFQDSTPVILFVGQVDGEMEEREAFQEIDYRRMFGPMSKWTAQIDRPARMREFVSRAFHTALSGRQGPVVLALPEHVLMAESDVLSEAQTPAAATPAQAHPGMDDIDRLRSLLAGAERPLVILGGGGWNAEACSDIKAFVEQNALPVGCAFRCQDRLENRHPAYIGDVGIGIHPYLAEAITSSDLVLAIGPRLGEMTTGGYTLLAPPKPKQPLVHVLPDPEEIGRVYQPTLGVLSGMAEFAAAARAMNPIPSPPWGARTRELRARYEATIPTRETVMHAAQDSKGVDMTSVVRTIEALVPEDTIITNGAGNYAGWVHKFYRFGPYRTQLAPTSGAMGYGVPAAVAAKIAAPERTVVSFNGDGCFMMNGQELATAVQYGASPIFIVVNNGMYGTIRMHQEREFPGRISATTLRNPDFAALAEAYGAQGETVLETKDFEAAFKRALTCTQTRGRPALIEVRTDPN